MRAVKRLEIVVARLAVPALVEALEKAGVDGYTVVDHVSGKGERGVRSDDEPTDALANGLVLTTCDAAALDRLVAAIRPLLKRFGGVCLVSDAAWVVHD